MMAPGVATSTILALSSFVWCTNAITPLPLFPGAPSLRRERGKGGVVDRRMFEITRDRHVRAAIPLIFPHAARSSATRPLLTSSLPGRNSRKPSLGHQFILFLA